jgi:threonine dehydrogenase-like Zn-dependent dehydrogenase
MRLISPVDAVKFGASKVFTTAGTDEKVKYLKDLTGGRAHAFNYKTQDFEQEIKKFDDGAGVDLVIDFVGPDYWNKVSVASSIFAWTNGSGGLIISSYLQSLKEHLSDATRRSNDHPRHVIRSQATLGLGAYAYTLQTTLDQGFDLEIEVTRVSRRVVRSVRT